jgi:4-hydroxybenzoate polyprenyltransferase/phosphoserine phosphatase
MRDSPSANHEKRSASVWDLDGTLLSTDVFGESVTRLMLGRPWMLPRVVIWLLQGRSFCKQRVAEATIDTWTRWPVRPEAEAMILEARQEGIPVVLATAAHTIVATRIAADLGCFDAVLATTADVNLKGERKLHAVKDWVRENGCDGFSYAGDSRADLALWRSADRVIVVEPTAHLERSVRALGKPVEVIGQRKSIPRSVIRALRPHQWIKNLLVFLPMILAHRFDRDTLVSVVCAFVAFSACASTVYLVNDIADLDADRDHPKKRRRPLASGRLAIPEAAATAAGLLLGATTISMVFLPPAYGMILAAYLATNLVYSTWLKRKPIVDVMMLAGMYAVRVEAGGVAAGVELSVWILAFSLFFFTSLAFVKRCAELRRIKVTGSQLSSARGYRVEDLPILESLGAASGYVSVLVLAMYMNSQQMRLLYGDSRFLWLICPLVLYWITRVWLLVHRGNLDEDPVVFAIRDRVSLLIASACFFLVMIAAFYRGQVAG